MGFFCFWLKASFYTIDYNANEYIIRFKKKEQGAYKVTLQAYLLRYCAERQVTSLIQDIPTTNLKEEINTCLEKLLDFVYDQVARKRRIGIDAMEELCKESLKYENKLEANKRIKEFIFTYFNSKYAREFPPHEIEIDGKLTAYSLVVDTNQAKEASWEVIFKYMNAVGMDNSGGFDDKIKHLRGATLRLLRTNPDNPSLLLLKGFTLLMLSTKTDNNTFQAEAGQEIWEGLSIFLKKDKDFNLNFFMGNLQQYKAIMERYSNNVTVFESIDLLLSGIILSHHNDWFSNNFKPKYLTDYGT